MTRWSWGSLGDLFGRGAEPPEQQTVRPTNDERPAAVDDNRAAPAIDSPARGATAEADRLPGAGEPPAGASASEALGVDGPTSETAPVEALIERASEQILGDESLRRNATDDEFQPLLDWALAAIGNRLAADPGSYDTILYQVRVLVRAADAALGADATARSQAIVQIGAEVGPPLFAAPAEVKRRLDALAADAPANGEQLARALAAALSASG